MYLRTRDSLEIRLSEWPLPESEVKSKAVVFELQVPGFIANWRDATDFMQQGVLKSRRIGSSPRASYTLSSDCHLSRAHFLSARTAQRIGLLSQDKPADVTHWRGKQVGLITAASVCVPNGLDYQYFDNSTNLFTSGGFSSTLQVPEACTYKLSGKYQSLQKYIFRPASMLDGIPANSAIALQNDCPSDMSLEEFKELASLPLGHRIQWENILVQLIAPSVDFKKTETAGFVSQCIYQTGPSSNNWHRSAHEKLINDTLALHIVDLLFTALERVK
jgi:hypothetical protein